jgi:hypothetical protein
MKNFFCCILLILFSVTIVNAQSHKRLFHLKGTRTINGINVKVDCRGSVDSIMTCSDVAGPYFIGALHGDENENGRVSFHFSKPVADVVLNFSGVSDIDGQTEEVIFYVNGKHYRLPAPGVKNGCEELALINEKGNMIGCSGCSISGWNGTKIKGPITTLTIIDSVITGLPNGTIFSISIGEPYIEPVMIEPITNTLVNYSYNITEGAAGKELVIESSKLDSATITINDKNGKYIPVHFQVIETNRVILDISDLPKGEYLLMLEMNGVVESQRFMVD